MTSIRHRLLILLLGLWIGVWFAVALITLERSGHEVGELLDAQLAQTARVLRRIALAGHLGDLASPPQSLSPVGHPYESMISVQLWQGAELIGTFGGAPTTPLAQNPGFSDHDIAGTKWRVFGLSTGRPHELLLVAQSYSIRQELIRFLTVHALEPVLWSLPLTVVLIWLAVGDGLRPLLRLARDIGRRSAERLAPVDEDGVPTEVRPLITALNDLMQRLADTLETERRFTAYASHELRTPLAVIRTHARIIQRARDDGERQEAIRQLVAGVDRAAHLVTQLLLLVRLTPDASGVSAGSWSLADTVAQNVDDHLASARAKSVELLSVLPPDNPCVVAVARPELGILVSNLIGNAIKYSPHGGRVRIAVDARGEEIRLQVADTGPGIPPADRERVFDHFYRPAGQTVPGAGLGLSIVKRICDLHAARITLHETENGVGLLVEVSFPAAVSSPI